jgi:hypothetical protein
MKLPNWVSRYIPKRLTRRNLPPPPLPKHQPRGLTINVGDTLQITKMSVALKDVSESSTSARGPMTFAIPAWATDFDTGAIFGLKRILPAAHYTVDGNIFEIMEDGRTVSIALQQPGANPLSQAYKLAEKVLDLLAVEAYRVSLLDDPLREYAVWHRAGGVTTLRCVSTSRVSVELHSETVVKDPSGNVRPQPQRPPQRWDPSHAYFRRSQVTDNLDDSYRYLYLALESLVSKVYPWSRDVSENAWLRAGLKHIMDGYGLDLNDCLKRPSRNPYRRFMKEQYQAQRCALFHAKITEAPVHPSDAREREDLVAATRRLGRLYVQLAGFITGAGFAGGGITYAAFSQMLEPMRDSEMYVSETSEFSAEEVIPGTTTFIREALGQSALHHLVGRWATQDLPEQLLRMGSFAEKDGTSAEMFYTSTNINTAGVDILECVIQIEMANAASLREWFL